QLARRARGGGGAARDGAPGPRRLRVRRVLRHARVDRRPRRGRAARGGRRDAAACGPAVRAVLRGRRRTLVVGALYVALGGALLSAVFDRAIVAADGGI